MLISITRKPLDSNICINFSFPPVISMVYIGAL